MKKKFGVPTSHCPLANWYDFDGYSNHWLAYDVDDQILPFSYLKPFLEANPGIKSQNYADAGHEKIIKSPIVINDLVEVVTAARLSKYKTTN